MSREWGCVSIDIETIKGYLDDEELVYAVFEGRPDIVVPFGTQNVLVEITARWEDGRLAGVEYHNSKDIEAYRTELSSLITQAQTLNTDKFSKETGKTLKKTLADAETISSKGAVSLRQMDETRYNLQESIDALEIGAEVDQAHTPIWQILLIVAIVLLAIAGIREKRWGSQVWAPLLCLALAAMQPMDYGWRGVLLIILMYLARRSAGGLAALMVAFCLYWGSGSSEVVRFFGLRLKPEVQVGSPLYSVVSMMFSFMKLQTLALLSLPFMLCQTNTGIKVPRWLAYGMYPGHLLLLWLIRQAI